MEVKASIVVQSHLSDSLVEITSTSGVTAIARLRFVKYIINECKGDLNQEINADELWEEFYAKENES